MSAVLHTKKCIRCATEKPLEEFYAHRSMRDGRLNACIDCVKAGVRSNYRRKHDYYLEYERQRQQEPERRAKQLKYQSRQRARNPDKYRARTAVGNAIRDGRLIRQPCQDCGSTEKVHAHHHDYSKPLDVEWLCKDCHWVRHGSVKSEAA